MSTLTKVFIVLNLLFSIAFATVVGVVLVQRTNWRAQLETEKGETKKVRDERDAAKTNYETTITQLRDKVDKAAEETRVLQLKLDTAGQQVTAKQGELDRALTDKATVTAEAKLANDRYNRASTDLEAARADLTKAKQDLAAVRKDVDDQNKNIFDLRSEIAALELRLTDMGVRYNSAKEELDRLQQVVKRVQEVAPDVYRIATGGAGRPVPPEPISAMVKAVSPDRKVIVLNVGADGKVPVKKGYRFLIHRGRDYIGVVEVVNVEKDMCATELVPPLPDKSVLVQVGDEAMTAKATF